MAEVKAELSKDGKVLHVQGAPISELFGTGRVFVIDDRGTERLVTGIMFHPSGKMLISIDPSGKQPGQFEW